VPLHTKLKKGLLLVTLCGLLVVGAGLLESFLPYEWRHAIHQRVESFFPSPVYAPHPNMDWEFELYFRERPWQRWIGFGVLGVLTLGDAYLNSKAWRAFRIL
jgi:hypothetical protein